MSRVLMIMLMATLGLLVAACASEVDGGSGEILETEVVESADEERFAMCADVIAVEVARDGETADGVPTYRFDVTVSSADEGWDKYADRWEVLDADGAVLGERILAHPHVDEQPFTRSQSGIPVPGSQAEVRAHDSVEGFCGRQEIVAIS